VEHEVGETDGYVVVCDGHEPIHAMGLVAQPLEGHVGDLVGQGIPVEVKVVIPQRLPRIAVVGPQESGARQ
jgi:hypothetical protein